MADFDGKIVLVTGAARRIGAGIARHMHARGARVAVHYRQSQRDALALASELEDQRADSVRLIKAELGSQATAHQVVTEAARAWGRLDILVNNASSFYPTPLESLTEADVDDLLASNYLAPLFLSQAALPHLRRAHGCIVNLVDIHAQGAMAGHSAYASAKAALAMLTRILARELAPDVRVNGVSPGAILWPEGTTSEGGSNRDDDADQASQAQIDAERQRMIERIPLQRTGSVEDIASTVAWLCSDGAGYVTGQIIAVDGGRLLS